MVKLFTCQLYIISVTVCPELLVYSLLPLKPNAIASNDGQNVCQCNACLSYCYSVSLLGGNE
jgi:hypothetical protein